MSSDKPMANSPRFSYYISPGELPVSQNDAVWHHPLPMSRFLSEDIGGISLSHGEYFHALRTFLENAGCEMICRELTRRQRQLMNPQDIQDIHIRLEKHGEFYHPARLNVFAHHQKYSFVLNVAVSDTGIRTIKNEYDCLTELNDEFSPGHLPEVYGFGEAALAGNRKIRMFLGHWFEGYHEFHVSRDPSDKKNKILVWSDNQRRFCLSRAQSVDLYRQAARILTFYYDVDSFEQIHSWHHGAGDFVVKIDQADLDIKLISARGYAPLFTDLSRLDNCGPNVELILQAMLIFFLNLSVRMRLDRYDGVGDIAWADRLAVKSTLDGFFDGLALKPPVASMPGSLVECFRYYLSVCNKEDLYELGNAVVKTFNRRAPEVRVVKQRLKEHVEELSQVIAPYYCR